MGEPRDELRDELRDDASGPYDAGFGLQSLTRRALAVLGREYLLHGHLQDRVGMPLVHTDHPREEMEDVAIDEWMSASPIYSQRMQRALHFGSGDVPTIFKNIQLDIGAPHHFLDFRCTVHDADNGEFFLAHCGALMDVEPMGEEYVFGMCHKIEDPTFDATAVATNPRAQVRPLHRPPRTPADRHPHCHWTVKIDDSYPPVEAHPNLALVRNSLIADIEVVDPGEDAEPGGWPDYSGEFDPDFALEDLSHRALVITLQEFAVQGHLLLRAFCTTVAQRYGADTALGFIPTIFAGVGGLTAQRINAALKCNDVASGSRPIASLLQLHPIFQPRSYVGLTTEIVDPTHLRVAFPDAPVFEETDGFHWFSTFADPAAATHAIDALIHAINPRAHSAVAAPRPGERYAFDVTVSPTSTPAQEAPEIALAKISTGASFVFTPRRPVRV